LVKDWGDTEQVKITRLDCTHDDIDACTVNIEVALDWYRKGLFNSCGRPPKANLRDDLGNGTGSTFNIGNRKNGKFLRIYEKGKQLGDPSSPWTRVEVEWHGKGRLIYWDTVINLDHYLAGAYPCLVYLSETQSRIKTARKATEISYDKRTKWVHTSAGKAINLMMEVEGDTNKVIYPSPQRRHTQAPRTPGYAM